MDSIDVRIAHAARPQAGVFTLDMTRTAGIPDSAVYRRVRRGSVIRIHPATFFAGSFVTLQARRWAAVLAAGPDALLGGKSAEDEWGIGRWSNTDVEVLVTRRQRPLGGVRTLQSRTVDDEDRAVLGSRPTTTVERTLVDVADRRSVGYLCRALREACFRANLDIARLERTIARNWNRRGIGKLRRALDLHVDGHGGTDSDVEDRFARMLERAGIPGVASNVVFTIGGTELRVDVWIEHLNLVVEIDPDWHHGAPILREDALRAALCRSEGKRHVRVPGDDLSRGVRDILRMHRAWQGSSPLLS